MITQREKNLIIITFCLTFGFALVVLVYPLSAALIVMYVIKNL